MSDSHRHGDDPVGRIVAIFVAMVLAGVAAAVWQLVADKGPKQHQTANYEQEAAPHLTAKGSVQGATQTPHPADHRKDAEQPVGPGTWPDWAIVGFTLMLTILGALQYRLDRRTARETKDALNIARDTAAAALASADIAGKSLVAEQRPWIEIPNVEAIGPLTWAEEGEDRTRLACALSASLVNVGRTPALDIQTFFIVEVTTEFDAAPVLEKTMGWVRKHRHSHKAIFPGATTILRTEIETTQSTSSIDKHFTYVILVVAYGSAFSNERYCTGVVRPLRVIDPSVPMPRFPRLGDNVPADHVFLSGGWMNLTHAD
jgi:hypothetical protein